VSATALADRRVRPISMIAVTWLVLAGCLVLALVFAIAADCVASSGPRRDEGREDGVDGEGWEAEGNSSARGREEGLRRR
jgi:hypothetical protein